jgi:spermidine synthase
LRGHTISISEGITSGALSYHCKFPMMSAVHTNVSQSPASLEVPRAAAPMGWALLAAGCSGASCLMYELVWSRYLHLIFGVSAYAVAAVLACFMVGLAIGSEVVGRWIDRRNVSARRAVITIEVFIGICLLVSPLFYRALSGWIADLLPAGHHSGFSRHVGDILLAMAMLGVPTFLMGGSLPAFVRLGISSNQRIGGGVGALYALNTLGGATGAFLAGFVILPKLGMTTTLVVGATLNFAAAGIVAWRFRNVPNAEPAPQPPRRKAKQSESAPPHNHRLMILVPAVFCISGFASLAYEVYWTRLLSYFFRDTIYDFTIVLTAFLAGIALGSAVAGGIVRRVSNVIGVLGAVQILVAACALIGLMIVSRFPYWLNDLQTNTAMVRTYGEQFWTAGTLIRFGYAFGLMLIPTTLFGATYPLVSSIAVRDLPNLASRFGRLNAINAVGSALGALLAGFLLINVLSVRSCIILTAALNLIAGLVLLRGWAPRIAAAVGFVILVAAVPSWDRLRMSTSFLDPHQKLEELLSMKFYREDAYGITSVVDVVPLRRRFLVTNRIYSQNTSEMNRLEDHRRLGHIPMLIHGDAKSVLTIGLGAGMTLRGIHDFAPAKIDCVELAPTVIDAARQFNLENGGVLDAPNVSVVPDDGRHFLSTSDGKYDAIVMDILHPMSSGSSGVFSREYYNLCRRSLQRGGIVCQWLPAHQLSLDQIKTIVATMSDVFPHTSLWYGMIGESVAVVGCIGSEQPLSIDIGRLQQQYANAEMHQALGEVGLGTPSLLLSHFIFADEAVRQWSRDAKIDTDDHPIIEFAAPKVAVQSRELGVSNLGALAALVGDITPYLRGDTPLSRLRLDVQAKHRVIEGLTRVIHEDPAGQRRIYTDAFRADPDSEDLRSLIRELER